MLPLAAYENIGKDNWNKRTKQIFGLLQDKFRTDESASFDELSRGINKRAAATSFFEILQLKTWNYLEVEQLQPYDDIKIFPGVSFHGMMKLYYE
jgi:cohesin complex subunit SCC1